eukprot:GHVS01015567.1.p1 GENE.GHVS01015567.1~~GHVS01015567.1.p1  ORF type:complete len:350 (-),score=89.88 GHVS01015567.1:375-1382(-)
MSSSRLDSRLSIIFCSLIILSVSSTSSSLFSHRSPSSSTTPSLFHSSPASSSALCLLFRNKTKPPISCSHSSSSPFSPSFLPTSSSSNLLYTFLSSSTPPISSKTNREPASVGCMFPAAPSKSSSSIIPSHQQHAMPHTSVNLSSSSSPPSQQQFLVGHGYDIHRLTPFIPSASPSATSSSSPSRLIIAGVPIDCQVGVVAHSDGDVVLHSICDAIFGALGLPDLGEHFPDTDQKWRGQSSDLFVLEARREMEERGWEVGNCDVTLILEKPKMKKYREQMRTRLRELLRTQHVNLKARTHEKVDSVGRQEALECHVVVLLQRRRSQEEVGREQGR